MVKKLSTDSPFYYKKDELTIYEDRMILPKLDNRVIYFSEVEEIVFEKIDFTLYAVSASNSYATVYMKDLENIELLIPLSGYYALKKFCQKGVKSDGKNGTFVINAFSLIMLVAFFIFIYVFVWSR